MRHPLWLGYSLHRLTLGLLPGTASACLCPGTFTVPGADGLSLQGGSETWQTVLAWVLPTKQQDWCYRRNGAITEAESPPEGFSGPERNDLLYLQNQLLLFLERNTEEAYKTPLFSTPSLAIIICRFFFFRDGHSNQCVLIPHYSFDLRFSSN